MLSPPSVLNVHTPTSSFALIHSLTQESLDELYDKLTRKTQTEHARFGVGPDWLKYEYNDSIWNLDDESDYTIFAWRQQERTAAALDRSAPGPAFERVASTSRTTLQDPPAAAAAQPVPPTLHMHDPGEPLPQPPAYCNASYYVFHPSKAHHCHPQAHAPRGASSKQNAKVPEGGAGEEDGSIPKLKRDFEKFHSENGVRTVMGSIGPVENVRMLLKAGHRHVYISRKFAIRHGFTPPDSAPGNYGYGGLLPIGEWPITLTPSASSLRPIQNNGDYIRPGAFSAGRRHQPPSPPLSHSHSAPHSPFSSPRLGGGNLLAPHPYANGPTSAPGGAHRATSLSQPSIRGSIRSRVSKKEQQRIIANEATAPANGFKVVMVPVYLSEEPHFDVVLGRSFFEKRSIKISSVDPTDVWCLDTGEKIECELVILKDGRGEIVTVT